jgi:type II secretory pathway pseudopilin PulG
MNPRPRSIPAFTLIELLVVIGLVAVLVALILPAVQQARESARRTECASRVRQLALALHSYHDMHRIFPINYGYGPYSSDNRGASWLQLILPHVEQGNLYARLQFGAPLSDPANTEVARTVVPVFICPSDSNPGAMTFRSNVPGLWGVQNYKACAGSNWEWGPFSPVVSTVGRNANNPDGLDHCNGLMCRNGQLDVGPNRLITTRLRDVRDGTSNTFALGETVPEWCRHTWWYWFNASTATCAIPLNYQTRPDLQVAMEGDWWHNYSFLSRHHGGAHFALVDGSARFVSENINQQTYRDLATIQGNEVVGDF